MMENKIQKFDKLSAQAGGGMIGAIIGVMIAVVILVVAVVPVVIETVSSSGTTGVTRTILNLFPVFLGISALVIVVMLVGMR